MMVKTIRTSCIYKASEDVISKNIEGIAMLIPVVSGVGNLDAEIFQLNDTGARIWEMLDGKTSLEDIISSLCNEYDAQADIIEQDVLSLIKALLKNHFIFEIN